MKQPRFDGRRFSIDGHRRTARFGDLLKWQLSGRRAEWPRWIENCNYPPPFRRVEGKELHATWIGQSTVLIQTAGFNILTDPYLSDRASPFNFAGPRRVRAAGLSVEQLPPIDVVLLSHNHFDHMDLPALHQVGMRDHPTIITPLGNARYIRRAGNLPVNELNWGESVGFRGMQITITPALHWSKRGFFDTNRALWGAFAVEMASGLVYFAGDTGFGDGSTFTAVRERFGRPRLSLLPIGAYEPRWFMKPQHMNPEDAVAAHLELDSRTSLAIHHSTLQLTDEPIEEPKERLALALAERNLDTASFLVPDVGETAVIP